MKQLVLSLIVLTLGLCGYASAGKKARDWQTGKLVDSQRSQILAGSVDRPGWVLKGKQITNDSKQAVYTTQDVFVIEGESLTYTVSEAVASGAKPAKVTVNGPIKFAIEDMVLYVTDEAGKEHRTQIMKKVLRTPDPSPIPKQ